MTSRGFIDLHNHMFAGLGFGGAMFHGAPTGPLDQALPWCTSAHGPGGVGDVVGTVLNAVAYHSVGVGHKVGGWPQFDGWPRWNSVTHQAVHVEMLHRAWVGGLRAMVMLAVNNEWMCGLPGMKRAPNRGCGDTEAVDLQLQAAQDLQDSLDAEAGGPGQGWYRIVRTPREAVGVIAAGKLAVILGIEVDNLFDGYLDSGLDGDTLAATVQTYFDKGVRYVFPVHFGDNAFGGAAFQNGLEFAAPAPKITTPLFTATLPYELTLEDGSHLGYQDRGGRMNVRGLTPLGERLVFELMSRGMLFDVDHMSYKTRAEVMDLAEAQQYPVISGHTGFIDMSIGSKRHEGNLTADEVERVRRMGGMVGCIVSQGDYDSIATYTRSDGSTIPHACGWSSNTFTQAYLYAVERMHGTSVGIGTDLNGFAGLLGPRSGPDACRGGGPGDADPEVDYPFNALASGADMDKSQLGNRTYDFRVDGLAHVGMLPDLIADLQAMGVTDDELAPLVTSADAFCRLWDRARIAGPGRSDLFFVKTLNTGNGHVEVHNATRISDYQSPDVQAATWFSTTDAKAGLVKVPSRGGLNIGGPVIVASQPAHVDPGQSGWDPSRVDNGIWQMVGDDLAFIKTRNTGDGHILVQDATADSGYRHGTMALGAWFVTGDADNGTWQMVGDDLYFIKTRNTGDGHVEVHNATRRSLYQTPSVQTGTWFSANDADNGTWQMVGDDLYFIKTRNTGTGSVEVHSATASSGFTDGTHLVTWFSTGDLGNGTWQMVGEDLYYIKTRNTGTASVEVHSATASSGFTDGTHLVTWFSTGDVGNGTWQLRRK